IPDAILDRVDAPDGGHPATVMLHAALRDTLVWRTHLGVKPWRTHGFYAGAGYGLFAFGGSITTGDVVSALVGKQLPDGLGSIPLVHISSTLHMLDVEAGWEWRVAARFKLRMAVAAATTLAASSSIHTALDGVSLPTLPG